MFSLAKMCSSTKVRRLLGHGMLHIFYAFAVRLLATLPTFPKSPLRFNGSWCLPLLDWLGPPTPSFGRHSLVHVRQNPSRKGFPRLSSSPCHRPHELRSDRTRFWRIRQTSGLHELPEKISGGRVPTPPFALSRRFMRHAAKLRLPCSLKP